MTARRQAAGSGRGRLLRDGQRQTGGQHRGGDVGEFGRGILGGQPLPEVAPGEGEDRATVRCSSRNSAASPSHW
jgi:hypothetical protein